MMFRRTRFDTGCTIEVEHSDAHLHAHVELDGDIMIHPGDRVCVHGAPIKLRFGERISERRTATVARANFLERAWIKLKSDLDLTEMYEITFTSGAR